MAIGIRQPDAISQAVIDRQKPTGRAREYPYDLPTRYGFPQGFDMSGSPYNRDHDESPPFPRDDVSPTLSEIFGITNECPENGLMSLSSILSIDDESETENCECSACQNNIDYQDSSDIERMSLLDRMEGDRFR